ncbi:hypothetical protein G7K_1045-t1 [Saitoella complicata NRRL Y-17804]|uniref:Uncharacterized protein n=1 Tax=Saitoella complicata (strain BCRC 22490 / CBS 7301 / JCM 7358 / NBRC 10748 / NRRL Y-17804) TaxID=698492 RepID=A0A0E9NAB4_SAICN|nr:hypothetical protein G7K_1045-t1 [Saitoella complicata NRRL Y-17804]
MGKSRGFTYTVRCRRPPKRVGFCRTTRTEITLFCSTDLLLGISSHLSFLSYLSSVLPRCPQPSISSSASIDPTFAFSHAPQAFRTNPEVIEVGLLRALCLLSFFPPNDQQRINRSGQVLCTRRFAESDSEKTAVGDGCARATCVGASKNMDTCKAISIIQSPETFTDKSTIVRLPSWSNSGTLSNPSRGRCQS